MHIYFSGIGGSGIGPLARIAKQAGYEVSGSDKSESEYTQQLRKDGIDLHIGQTTEAIAKIHNHKPINWFVYTSALPLESPDHPELKFAKANSIKTSRRDELLNHIIKDKWLKLIGVAGTHGKSTTTAMVIWLFHQLGIPIGHSVGAKIPFAPMGQLQEGSEYFVYECDEFDRNFLAFHPQISAITGISWDHHEIFPTQDDYQQAFRDFIAQSKKTVLWQADSDALELGGSHQTVVLQEHDSAIKAIHLPGEFNRRDAWLAIQTVHAAVGAQTSTLLNLINSFPGLKQRMEKLAPNLYSNYAHTPEKIMGGMSTALEIAATGNQKVVVIYEPLTNRRQHYIKDTYKDCFAGASKLYWVPTYLAREDENLPLLGPKDLIPSLTNADIAEPAEMDAQLLEHIKSHLKNGDLVVAMGASGAGSLDEWLRKNIKENQL